MIKLLHFTRDRWWELLPWQFCLFAVCSKAPCSGSHWLVLLLFLIISHTLRVEAQVSVQSEISKSQQNSSQRQLSPISERFYSHNCSERSVKMGNPPQQKQCLFLFFFSTFRGEIQKEITYNGGKKYLDCICCRNS